MTSVQNKTTMSQCPNCRMETQKWVLKPPMFEYLLSTNDPPDCDADVRMIVESGTRDLKDIEKELTRITGVMEQLKASRDLLKKHVSDCKLILAPIRKLPAELLSEIFLYCCSEAQGRHASAGMSLKMRAPQRLLGVCRLWRVTATSLQDLWTSIDITLGFKNSATHLTNLSGLLGLHLQRSKAAPLSINIVSRNEADVRPFLDALAPHSSRWQFARFAVPEASLQRLSGIKGSLDCLDRLDLCVNGSHSPDPVKIEMFEFAPQLSSLRLSTHVAGRQCLPWSQLSRLELSLSLSQCLLALSLAPGITECFLSCEHKSFDNLNTPIPVHLSHLHSLHIDGMFGSSISALSFLTTPMLESFSLNTLSLQLIDKEAMESTDLVDALLPFIRRASRTLKNLRLYGSSLEVDVFTALLKETPNLRHLSLDDHSGLMSSESVQLQLKYCPDSRICLAPLLETIKVTVVPIRRLQQFDFDAFVDLIESRWNVMTKEPMTAQIRAVSLVDSKARENIVACTRLENLQSQGLQLDISG